MAELTTSEKVIDDLYDPDSEVTKQETISWSGVSVTGMQDIINARQNAGIKLLLAKVDSLDARLKALEGA